MKLEKIKKTWGDYKLEVSWGQLEAVKKALDDGPPDPVSDEMLAELEWYMANVPGPGEEEEDVKSREDEAKNDSSEEGDEDEGPIPLPPSEEGDYKETTVGEGPEEPEGSEMPERPLQRRPALSSRLPSSPDEDFESSLPSPPAE